MWQHWERHWGEPGAVIAVAFIVVNLLIDLSVRHKSFGRELTFVILPGLGLLLLAGWFELAGVYRLRHPRRVR